MKLTKTIKILKEYTQDEVNECINNPKSSILAQIKHIT